MQMQLNTTYAQAGDVVTVQCFAADAAGQPQRDTAVQMEIVPPVPVQATAPHEVSYAPTKAGHYAVHCRTAATGVAALPQSVTVVSAAPAALEARLAGVQATAGLPTQGRCVGRDAFGNDVPVPEAQWHVPPQVSAHRGALQAAVAGTYSISCQVPAWPHLPASPPVPLSVAPAAPHSVRTWLTGSRQPAHTPVTVRCEVQDAFENPIVGAASTFRVEGPGPVEVGADSFVAARAGTYQVHCQLPQAEPSIADAVGATAQVVAGTPARWSVQLHRQGKCFSQGRLPLTWQVFDAYDNEVDNVQVALEAAPEHGVMRDASGGYLFLDEAEYDISLRVVSPDAPNLAAWTEHIVVDSTPPQLEIVSPARGAMLQSGAPTQLLVGQVHDKLSALTEVTIAGQKLALDPNGPQSLNFAVPHDSQWGLNILQASAEDACGNVALITQSYLQSAQFGEVAHSPDPAAAVASGVRVRFNQKLWDDGDRSTTDDVATLLERALDGSHLDERLPYRLLAVPDSQGRHTADEVSYNCIAYTATHKSGLEVTRNGPVTYARPEVEYLRPVDGGWHVAFVLRELTVPVRVTYFIDGHCVGGTSQSVDATLVTSEVRVEAAAQVWMEGNTPRVSMCPTCMHISFGQERPRLQVDWGHISGQKIGHALNSWLNWLLTGYTESMSQALEGKVRQDLTQEMGAFLQGLRLEHSLPLPAPWRGTIQVASGLDSASLHGPEGSGYGEFGLYTQFFAREAQLVAPNATVRLPDPLRGSIRRDAAPPSALTTSPDKGFALAVHDDLLNQMFWALWDGGAFTQRDLREVLTSSADPRESSLLDAATLRLFFTSPPVLMPGDRPGEVKLGVGDAYAEADCDLYGLFGVMAPPAAPRLQASFYFSTVVTAHLDVDADSSHLVVTPVGVPEIHVQVTQTSNPSFQPVVTTWLERALRRSVPPMLARALGTFPLPVLQINRMARMSDDAVWRLHDASLERPAKAAQFVLRGNLHEATQSTQ
jgi:hypothetical protein